MISIDPKELEQAKRFLETGVKTLNHLLDYGIQGVGPLKGASALAAGYKQAGLPLDRLQAAEALLKNELRKNFASGFFTSLGGFVSLPLAIPASMAASWVLQIRCIAAIADLAGFDVNEPPVRTAIGLALLGNRGKELVESDFNELQVKLAQGNFNRLPKKTLLMINQRIVSKLSQMAGQKGLTRLGKAIPLAGGLVGGALDYYSAQDSGRFALELFGLIKPEGTDA
ncbi:MAG: EcsC family protein [bacterium]|nr:EcsC family protein [bacterium]